MGDESLAAETVAGVYEALRAAVHIRVVDLRGVTNHYEFRTTRHAGDDGFRLERRELLGLVEDEEAVRDRTATYVAKRLDLEQAALDQLLVRFHDRMVRRGFGLGRFLFAVLALIIRRTKRHEHFTGVVDRLKPRVHFFIQRAGEETQRVAHRDDRTAHSHAIEIMPPREEKPGRDSEQGFSRSCLTVTSDERNRGIEQRIEEALLTRICGAELDAFRNLDRPRDVQPHNNPAARVARGEVLAAGSLKKHILVHLHPPGPLGRHFDLAGTPEALELVRLDGDLAKPAIFHIALRDFIAEVILALNPDGHRAELHVDVLRHEDRRRVRPLLEREAGPNDASVHAALVGKNFVKPLHRRRLALRVRAIAHQHAHRPTADGRRAFGDAVCILPEDLAQKPVSPSRIRAALALLILEIVELRQHLDRDEHMVVLKPVQAMRVVQQHIRIEHEILREALGFWVRILVKFGKENPLFLVGLKDGRSEHQLVVEGWEKRPPLSDPG